MLGHVNELFLSVVAYSWNKQTTTSASGRYEHHVSTEDLKWPLFCTFHWFIHSPQQKGKILAVILKYVTHSSDTNKQLYRCPRTNYDFHGKRSVLSHRLYVNTYSEGLFDDKAPTKACPETHFTITGPFYTLALLWCLWSTAQMVLHSWNVPLCRQGGATPCGKRRLLHGKSQ